MHGTVPDISAQEQRRRGGAKRVLSGPDSIIKSPRGIRILVIAADALALFVASLLFYMARIHSGFFIDMGSFPFEVAITAGVLLVFCWMFLFWFSGVYLNVHNRALFDEYYTVLKVVLFGFVLLVTAVYIVTPTIPSGQRSYRFVSFLLYFLLVAGSIGISRLVVRVIVRRLRRRGIGLRKTLIIGCSERSLALLHAFGTEPELGYEVVGTVAIDGEPDLPFETTGTTDPERTADPREFARLSLGTIDEVDRIVPESGIEVTVLGMDRDRDLVLRLMTESAVAETTIKVIPDLYDIVSGRARAHHLYGIPLIEVDPEIMSPWEQKLKRLLDVGFSTLVLLLGLPIWLLVALIIYVEDRGPVLYSQERVGQGGRRFTIQKYRSMRTDAEKAGISWTTQNDPRVTRVGNIIRRLHIDEIPQFWNVLIGEMSIVGPRPERPFYVEKYTELLPAYPRRLRVKPGLTGWNQVQAGEIVENVEFVRERIRHDFFYIENMSLRLDIEIIFRTILRVIQRKGQA